MVKHTGDDRINVREAAKECGRNPETVRRWIWSGKLPAQKLGNQLFVKREDLVSYCRETATLPYQAAARSVPWEEHMDRIHHGLRDTASVVRDRKAKLDFLQNAAAVRNEIHRRTHKVFSAEDLIRELRDEREHELE